MELSPLRRRAAFGLIVVALVALGAYLLGPVAHGVGRPAPAGANSPSPSASAANSLPPPARSTANPGSSGPNIYQWLPFTQAGLAAAVSVAVRFGDSYGTFSYTQSTASYGGSLRAVTSPQLLAQIEAAYSTPGIAAARASAKQVSVGSAVIASLRAFGPSSLTFVVQVTQRITGLSGRSDVTTSYAVTLTGSGTSWQVSDVELASAGNS